MAWPQELMQGTQQPQALPGPERVPRPLGSRRGVETTGPVPPAKHTGNKMSLTRVIFRKSKDGRGQRVRSSRRRRHLLPTSTHGCERHRSRPSCRPSSGVDERLLLVDARAVPSPARCSWDRDRRRHQGGHGPLSQPFVWPLLAQGSWGAGGTVGPGPRLSCGVALPPLWHRLLDTGVQTLEPPGRQGERQRASPSGSDSERQWRLVGGAKGGPVLSLRSVVLTAPRPASGPRVPVTV